MCVAEVYGNKEKNVNVNILDKWQKSGKQTRPNYSNTRDILFFISNTCKILFNVRCFSFQSDRFTFYIQVSMEIHVSVGLKSYCKWIKEMVCMHMHVTNVKHVFFFLFSGIKINKRPRGHNSHLLNQLYTASLTWTTKYRTIYWQWIEYTSILFKAIWSSASKYIFFHHKNIVCPSNFIDEMKTNLLMVPMHFTK